MTDYQPLLARALKGLERNTSETRRAVYDRARQALLNQLRSANPPMLDADITRERLALEDAIRKTETEAVLAEPHSVRAPTSARMPGAPVPPRPAGPVAPPSHRPAVPREPRIPMPPSGAPRTAPPPGRMAPPLRPRPPMPEEISPEREIPAEDSPFPPEDAIPPAEPAAELPPEFELEAAPPPPPPSPPRRPRPMAREPEIPAGDFPPPHPVSPGPIPPGARPRGPRPPGPGVGPAPGIGAPGQPRKPQRGNNKAKIVLAGLAALVLAGAGVFAFTYRARPPAPSTSSTSPAPTVADSDQPKSSERIAPSADSQAQPSAPSNLDPSVAQRAVLYEENPGGGQQFQNFVGTAVWKTEAVNAPGRAPDLGLRIEIEIPDRKINVTLKMRRNTDPSFPASHTVEVIFAIAAGDPFGGVADMRGIRAKGGETAQGSPLSAEVQKVKEGYFLLALPQIDEDSNLQMLRERDWVDIPFVYANGRRAVLTFQKGTPGERALREVLNSWGKGGASN